MDPDKERTLDSPLADSVHEEFMAVALGEAREAMNAGDRPFGSVLVYHGNVVGKARNRAISGHDPTNHGEILTIKQAAQQLAPEAFQEAILYTTCEPCPMCCGAILWAGIHRVVLGARFEALDRFSTRLYHYHRYSIEKLRDMIGFNLEITNGILVKECEGIFRDWESRL